MLNTISTSLVVTIFVVVANSLLGLIVFAKNWRHNQNIFFALFTWFLSFFILANFFGNAAGLSHWAILFINKNAFFWPPLALFFMLIFSISFVGLWPKYFNLIGWTAGLTSLAVAILGASNLVSAGFQRQNAINVAILGPLVAIYYFFMLAIILAVVTVLILGLVRLRGAARVRVGYVTISFFIMAAIVVTTEMILPFTFNNYSLSIYGSTGTLVLVGGMAYAMIRHHLFDIRLVVTRSITYAALLFSLGVIYALLAFRLGNLIFHSDRLSTSEQYFNVTVAILLAFTFQPLRRFFEKVTDRIFYRDKYDPQKLINQIGRVLAAEIEIARLSRDVIQLLAVNLRVRHVDIVVLQKDTVFYEAGGYFAENLVALARDLAQLGDEMLVADELVEGDDRKELLRRYGLSVFVVLKTHDEKIGYLLFSDKRNGNIYSGADLRIINIVADELAIAVHNARSYTQIQHFNETLQAKVTQATAELRAANLHLQQLDAIKDEFIAMASHQLGTPLVVIDGYISMLKTGIYGPVTPRQYEPLSKALHRVQLLKRLVADFLNISRIQAGRFLLDISPTDLNTVVPEEIEMLADRAREKETLVQFVKPPKPVPIIMLDEQKIRQAIMNLIDNAIFYTPGGHVKVYLRTTATNVVFEVVDNGIGVPENQKADLFRKFFRATNAKRERPNGTGIGLFLVRRVIETQGGRIVFASVENEGSSFGFSLPLSGVPSVRAIHASARPLVETPAASPATKALPADKPATPLREEPAADKLKP